MCWTSVQHGSLQRLRQNQARLQQTKPRDKQGEALESVVLLELYTPLEIRVEIESSARRQIPGVPG